MKKILVILPVIALILSGLISTSFSEEYSTIKDNTVLGQNFGYPSGTQGQTPIGDVDLVLETAVFMKNLELIGFNEQTGIDGETFIGFLVPIRGRYRAHESLTFEFGAVLGHNPTTTLRQEAGVTSAVLGPNAFIAHRRAISRPHPAQHEFPGRKYSSWQDSNASFNLTISLFNLQ